MKEPWQWREDDIKALITEQRKEDLQLEYKKSDALAKTDAKKAEISKDVSAMANSAGGLIAYGIDEQKKSNGPIRLDCIDSNEISVEWLEQVIDSGVQRRIDGVRVNPVKMMDTGRFVYLVWVPQSSRAPHMAADHRYYKRLGTTTAKMEEYEVRDVGRRLESPDLHLDLHVRRFGGSVMFAARIGNSSPEPAYHATCRLYIEAEQGADVDPRPSNNWSITEPVLLLWNDCPIRFHVARFSWSVPMRHPVLEEEHYQLDDFEVNLHAYAQPLFVPRAYLIGWELRAPKAVAKLQGLKLIVDLVQPRIEPQTYALARP